MFCYVFLTDFFKNLISLFLAAVGHHCYTWALSSCGEQASHRGGFSGCRAWALGVRASAVAAHRLSGCGIWA